MPSSLNRLLPGIKDPARSRLIPIAKAKLSRSQPDLTQNDVEGVIPSPKPTVELHNVRRDLTQITGRPILSLSLLEKVRTIPLYHCGWKFERVPYWQSIPHWKDVPERQFLSYEWNVSDHSSTCTQTFRSEKNEHPIKGRAC